MKITAIKLSAILLFITSLTFSQKDWSAHNFEKENKRDVSASGSAVKSLQQNKSFINSYVIGQATNMKGSEKSSGEAIYSEVGIKGVDIASFQKIVDKLHGDFVEKLEGVGVNLMEGEAFVNTKTAKKYIEKEKDYYLIGNIGNATVEEGKYKIENGSILGYPMGLVRNDVKFQPTNKTIYTCSHLFKSGLFYQNMFSKEKINLITVSYNVTYANFDGGRGYKKITLETKPMLAVNAKVTIMPAKGKAIYITYEKPIIGSTDWSLGLDEVRDNESSAVLFGLARSAGYVLSVDSKKYLDEVTEIINALQNDVIAALKEEME